MSESPPVSHLAAHLGYWFRFVSNHVSHAFARALEAEGVTVAEWATLRALYGEPGLRPSALADRMGLSRGAITKLADRLFSKQLVAREDVAGRARAHLLVLTTEGQALVPRLANLADINDKEFFGHLDTETRATIEAALKDIVTRRGLKAVPLS